jgi:hypothetical protein
MTISYFPSRTLQEVIAEVEQVHPAYHDFIRAEARRRMDKCLAEYRDGFLEYHKNSSGLDEQCQFANRVLSAVLSCSLPGKDDFIIESWVRTCLCDMVCSRVRIGIRAACSVKRRDEKRDATIPDYFGSWHKLACAWAQAVNRGERAKCLFATDCMKKSRADESFRRKAQDITAL